MSRDSGDTARLLIAIALAFQVVGFLVLLVIGLVVAAVPILGGLVLFLAFVAFICVLLIYFLCYARAANGDYEDAKGPTLVFGILGLVTGGIVTGVLLIIAYIKLGDAEAEVEPPPWETPAGAYGHPSGSPSPYGPPRSAVPPRPSAAGPRFCPNCGTALLAPSRFCRSCGAALA